MDQDIRPAKAAPYYDLAIVAGDVADRCAAAAAVLAPFGPALFVPGNHEHYGHILQDNIVGRRLGGGEQELVELPVLPETALPHRLRLRGG